jgi:hypothetical protein
MTTIRWVPTELDPHKMIAEPTLNAVRTLLGAQLEASPPAGSTPDGSVIVRVDAHASLGQVGGVVRVDDRVRGPVGIARIGRTSFVAFQLSAEGLRQVPVHLDEDAGTLRVQRG